MEENNDKKSSGDQNSDKKDGKDSDDEQKKSTDNSPNEQNKEENDAENVEVIETTDDSPANEIVVAIDEDSQKLMDESLIDESLLSDEDVVIFEEPDVKHEDNQENGANNSPVIEVFEEPDVKQEDNQENGANNSPVIEVFEEPDVKQEDNQEIGANNSPVIVVFEEPDVKQEDNQEPVVASPSPQQSPINVDVELAHQFKAEENPGTPGFPVIHEILDSPDSPESPDNEDHNDEHNDDNDGQDVNKNSEVWKKEETNEEKDAEIDDFNPKELPKIEFDDNYCIVREVDDKHTLLNEQKIKNKQIENDFSPQLNDDIYIIVDANEDNADDSEQIEQLSNGIIISDTINQSDMEESKVIINESQPKRKVKISIIEPNAENHRRVSAHKRRGISSAKRRKRSFGRRHKSYGKKIHRNRDIPQRKRRPFRIECGNNLYDSNHKKDKKQ